MAIRPPAATQEEQPTGEYCRRDERSSALGTTRTDPLAEAEVVAGHGAATTVEYQPRSAPPGRGLAALRSRDFRLFWSGQVISLIGTWMQIVAQSWLVLELTDSAFLLGVLTAVQFLPILVLSILGGVIADRAPRRSLLLGTQVAGLLLALALGLLTQTGLVRLEYVIALALLLGLVNAVDMPTRQALVVELVDAQNLRNAIALNSVAFNSARLVGPAAAGLAIGYLGLAGAFYINGASFLAAIAGLLAIRAGRVPASRGVEPTCVWDDLREGLAYVARTPQVRLIVLLVGLVGTFGMNLAVLVPVLARQVFGLGAEGFGFLIAGVGVGSLLAAILLATLSPAPRPRLLLGSAAGLGLAQVLMVGVGQPTPALILLGAAGFALIVLTTLSNAALQIATPDALRGRVMAVYTTVFAGTTPIGGLLVGALAQARGVRIAFFLAGFVSLVSTLAVYYIGRRHRGVDG